LEQDAALQESLRQDQEKERKKKEEEEKKRREEEEARRALEEEEERKEKIRKMKIDLANLIPDEPGEAFAMEY
jgi:FAS-associated factor 2